MSKTTSYWKKCFEQGKEQGRQKKKEHKKKLKKLLMGDDDETE